MPAPRSGSSSASVSRREFARLLSFGGSAALLAHPALAGALQEGRGASGLASLPVPTGPDDERGWKAVRAQFLMPDDLHLFNAANLCPAPKPVVASLADHTRGIDATPSPTYREDMHRVKETTRRKVAEHLRVTAEEILITRNTSEGNNFVSNGLDLGAGDEVIVFADNHPSNLAAWREKGKRFGYSVTTLPQPSPHPGADYYVEAARKAISSKTKLIGFSHVSNTVGDLLPARELCALARERGVMTLVDGAQTLGALDVDLRAIDPDFYTGSAHKWPCGPLEAGVLFVHQRVHTKVWPSVISLYPGQTGISKTFEGLGQRDEPAIQAFGDAIDFLRRIGQPAIEARARSLAAQLASALRRIDGVTVRTSPDPSRSTTVVSCRPGGLAAAPLAARLFDRHGLVCAVRGGDDRGGLRFSPHMYNSREEIDLVAASVREVMRTGL